MTSTIKKVNNKTIEEKYQSKTQEQHILDRPDTYIGDIELQTENMFVYDETTKKIVEKNISYVPGLYKIFDEIIVNARDQSEIDKLCDTIMVTVEQDTGMISVYNNGKGIDVEIHAEHKIYVPELIFGKLLTSTNYDDTEQRTTGGRNGYGAKLTNIYSSKFIVEVYDIERNRYFYQEFTNNMYNRTVPIIKEKQTQKQGFTRISFIPDYARFKLPMLTDDMISLLKKRVIDIAGTTSKCKVYYNNEKITCKDFKTYIGMYKFNGQSDDSELSDTDTDTDDKDASNNEAYKLFFETVNDKWEVGFMYAPFEGRKYISFVNGICTYHGGTHVNYVINIIIDKFKEMIVKKYKDFVIKPDQIKDNLILFVNSIITNPSFTSQTKETLKTKATDFGSICNIKDTIIKRFSKSGILNQVIEIIKMKEQLILKKTDGKKINRIKGIPKLEDANRAGTNESNKCYLILTEGDSAKTLAMSGLSVIGSDYFGIYPLKGKPLNVREASNKQLLENEEIINIKQIMGLQHNVKYTSTNLLRYNGIIIMSDADFDGSHIKGLILNMFHTFWPSLLQIPNFITSLLTPVIKASKQSEIINFYNIIDYEKWKETVDSSKWNIKYYKGLGTSTSKEAVEYFTNIYEKLINYIDISIDGQDTAYKQHLIHNDHHSKIVHPKYIDSCTESITLAFEKCRSHDRKKWIQNYNRQIVLDPTQKKVTIEQFINKELIHFSNNDVERSIPSICDGLKPSQRKILFSTILKKLTSEKNEIRVAQLAGFVSERACYHHGEASLMSAIISMAQNFVGSNNINLLFPSGQFGSRILGGHDHASPRYNHTFLAELTRYIFRPEDDPILTYIDDDGIQVEPEYYIPIIPMILVNGAHGIGTGFSTSIPCYNPLQIIDNVLAIINNKEMTEMIPWYKNFKGSIVQNTDEHYKYMTYGCCSKTDETHLKITELPLGMWTTKYKEILDDLETKNIIKSYITNNTEEIINTTIEFDIDTFNKLLSKNEIFTSLKLTSCLSTSNMYLYTANGCIKKYNTALDIINEFFDIRYEMYVKRKQYIVSKLTKELELLNLKIRFINDIIHDNIIIKNNKKENIITKLIELHYPTMSISTTIDNLDDDTVGQNTDISTSNNYDYLLSMSLMGLSYEKITALQKKCNEKQQELTKINNLTEFDIWEQELIELKEKYIIWLESSSIKECSQQISSKVIKKKSKK